MSHLVPMGCLTVAITLAAVAAPGGESALTSRSRPANPWPNDLADLKSPVRLDLGDEGELLVSDYAWQRVLTVKRDTLEILDSFSVRGRPSAVAFHNGLVFVGNDSTGIVSVHSPDGRFLYQFNKQIEQPADIAISPEDELAFVVAGLTKTVEVFSLDGKYIRTIPPPGQEAPANPTAVALWQPPLVEDVDRDGVVGMPDLMAILGSWGRRGGAADVNRDGKVDVQDLARILSNWNYSRPDPEVLVSDFGDPDPEVNIDPAVRIYDLQGGHLKTISGAGRFSRPQGLAVNGSDQLFVADSLMCKILVFDIETGEIVRTVGEFGSEPGQLRLPLDLIIDPDSGDLFVTNSRLGRIEVFREGGR